MAPFKLLERFFILSESIKTEQLPGISESNNNKHSKIINHVVLNNVNWKLRGFPSCLHIPSRQPQKGFWVFSFWFCRKESWLYFQLVSQILSSLALLRRLFRLWIRLELHSSGWGNFFSRDQGWLDQGRRFFSVLSRCRRSSSQMEASDPFPLLSWPHLVLFSFWL